MWEERYRERESQGETERQNEMVEVDSGFSALDYKYAGWIFRVQPLLTTSVVSFYLQVPAILFCELNIKLSLERYYIAYRMFGRWFFLL